MFARLAALLVNRPWPSAIAVIAVILAITGGVVRLRADFSISAFFGLDDPETNYLTAYEERWGGTDLLVLVADGGDEGLLTRARLDALDGLAKRLESVEGVGTVMSLTRVMRVSRGPGGAFIPVPLLATAPRADAEEARLAAWRDALKVDPQVVPQFLSADGRYGTVLVALDVDTNDLAKVRPVVRRVEELLAQQPVAGVTMWLGGVPAIRADVLDVVVADQIIAVPIAATLMGLMLLLLFRSLHGVIIPGLAAGAPLFLLLGTMGWTGEPFGLLNQSYLALIPAIAVADAVHLVARFHEETRSAAAAGTLDAATRNRAIAQTLQAMGLACFLTSFTTVVGFASLVTTEMNVLRMFGVYAAVGVAYAWVTVLFIVPLTLLGAKSGAKRLSEDRSGRLGRILGGFSDVARFRSVSVIVGAGLVTALSVWAGTWVVSDFLVTKQFHESHPVSVANAIVDDQLGGVLSLEFDLTGPPGAFADPAVLAALDAAEADARTIPSVRMTIGPSSILRTTARLVGGKDMLPETDTLAVRLYEIANQAGLVSAFVSDERDRARLIVRSRDIGAIGFLDLGERVSEQLETRIAPLGVKAHLTGGTFVSSRGLTRVTGDLFQSLLSAFVVIGVIISVLFRSLRYGVLSLIPNVLPLIAGYGFMGLMGWELEPARAVVFTVAVGLSVDSAIHVLARFGEERRRGLDIDAAIDAAVLHSGRAILITSLMLVVGFGANMFSMSPANAAFGRLGSFVILAGVVSNLLILPAMLHLGFGGVAQERGVKP